MSIARALKAELTPDESRSLEKALTDNAEGWHAANVKKLAAGATFGLERCKKEFNTKVTTMSDADRKHGESQLQKLDHLVVVDLFMTETAELAEI